MLVERLDGGDELGSRISRRIASDKAVERRHRAIVVEVIGIGLRTAVCGK